MLTTTHSPRQSWMSLQSWCERNPRIRLAIRGFQQKS
jgi:hypothetical protein